MIETMDLNAEQLADRIKLVLSDEAALTGEACKHGWDRAACVMRECNNPFAFETLLQRAEQLLRGKPGAA